MNAILIFGYGKWAKKIIRYLKSSKKFKKIYVKTSSNFFIIYPQKKNLNFKLFESYLKKVNIIHICTPTEKHFEIIKKNKLFNKNLIVEKPLVKKISELISIKSYFKKNKIIVNYIDLYNPLMSTIKNDLLKIIDLDLNYGNKSQYNNKFGSLYEWLDHPLSIILFLFRKFPKFKIISFISKNKKSKYFEKLNLNYKFNNLNINIKINHNYPKSQRFICAKSNSKVIKYNLKRVMRSSKLLKKNNLNFLYNDINDIKVKFFQKYNFHKKLFLEKNKIVKYLLKNKNKEFIQTVK